MTMTNPCLTGVRIATVADEDAIYDLLTGPDGLYEENALFTMSKRKVRQTIANGCVRANGKLGDEDGPQGIIGVIEADNKIVATIGMGFTTFWYTEEWHLSEFWNFVHPDYRNTNYAVDMMDFGKWCSDQLGIPLHMGVISTERVAGKVRLYQRKLRYVGGYFMHGIPENMPKLKTGDV